MEYLSSIVKYKKFLLLFILLLITILSFFIKDIKIDSSMKKFFIKNDPNYLYYKKIVKIFGSNNAFIIGIEDKNIFTYKKILILRNLVYDLENLKGVEEVDSLFNQKDIIYRNGVLHTELFIDPENIPKDNKILNQVKIDALNNPLINKNFISDNGKLFLIRVMLKSKDTSAFNILMTKKVENVLDKYKKKLKNIKLFGSPYISAQINHYIIHDALFTVPFAIMVIFFMIYVNLRNLKLTLIPIITSLLSIIAALGFMGLMHISLSMLTAIIPALIVLIGTTEDSYLISEYIEEIKNENNKEIILNISNKLGLPIILTSFTTVVGFLSIYLNKIEILEDFALVSSFGIFINFLITIIIVPIMLHIMNIKVNLGKTLSYKKIINFIINVFENHTKKVYLISLFTFFLSIIFIPRINVDNNLLNYFKKSSNVRYLADYFKSKTHGIQAFYIIVKAPHKKDFRKWKYLHALEKIENFIKSNKVKFNYAISIASYLSLVNQEMHDHNRTYFKVPKNKNTIAAYYTFFYRNDIKKYIDTKYQTAKIDVYHNIFSSYEFNKQLNILKIFIKNNIDPTLKINITGKNVLINQAADTISIGQSKSLLFTLIMVFIVIILTFKTFKSGLVILIGNFLPLMVLFGVMGAFNISLNIVTAIIATITYGIIVDDTIHIMMRYRYEHTHGIEKNKALIDTIKGEGRAVILTSFSLIIGYFTLVVSNFVPVIQFALLSILVISVALLSDLFLIPSIIKNLDIKRRL